MKLSNRMDNQKHTKLNTTCLFGCRQRAYEWRLETRHKVKRMDHIWMNRNPRQFCHMIILSTNLIEGGGLLICKDQLGALR